MKQEEEEEEEKLSPEVLLVGEQLRNRRLFSNLIRKSPQVSRSLLVTDVSFGGAAARLSAPLESSEVA